MFSFNIEPFVGALPIRFGMNRAKVHELLGTPEASHAIWDRSGTTDYWNESRVNVGYDNQDIVNHVGLAPGGCELFLNGNVIWSVETQPDPNGELLHLDPAPLETMGILVFTALGISTGGYHDSDDAQRSLTVSPAGAWDEILRDSKRPDLKKYRKGGEQT